MKVITGRLAEHRLYLYYSAAVFRPGIRVPTFGHPPDFDGSLENFTDDDLKLVVEEGRRTIDRQQSSLEQIRARSSTVLTVALAEIAVLSALATKSFKHGPAIAALWCLSAIAIVLAVSGASSVLTSQARMGWVNAREIASGTPPVLREAALFYLRSVGEGQETVRTRLTVLRDAVLLESIAAVLLAVTWPFSH